MLSEVTWRNQESTIKSMGYPGPWQEINKIKPQKGGKLGLDDLKSGLRLDASTAFAPF